MNGFVFLIQVHFLSLYLIWAPKQGILLSILTSVNACLIVVGGYIAFFQIFHQKSSYNDPPILPKCKIRTYPHILLSTTPY